MPPMYGTTEIAFRTPANNATLHARHPQSSTTQRLQIPALPQESRSNFSSHSRHQQQNQTCIHPQHTKPHTQPTKKQHKTITPRKYSECASTSTHATAATTSAAAQPFGNVHQTFARAMLSRLTLLPAKRNALIARSETLPVGLLTILTAGTIHPTSPQRALEVAAVEELSTRAMASPGPRVEQIEAKSNAEARFHLVEEIQLQEVLGEMLNFRA